MCAFGRPLANCASRSPELQTHLAASTATDLGHLLNASSPSGLLPMRSIGFATIAASSLVLLSNSVSAFSCHPSATRATSGTAGVSQLSFKADCVEEVDLGECKSLRKRIRYVGGKVLGRTDTMRAAGLSAVGRHPPMQMGFKSNVGLLLGAFLFKWYRARFINKVRGQGYLFLNCIDQG